MPHPDLTNAPEGPTTSEAPEQKRETSRAGGHPCRAHDPALVAVLRARAALVIDDSDVAVHRGRIHRLTRRGHVPLHHDLQQLSSSSAELRQALAANQARLHAIRSVIDAYPKGTLPKDSHAPWTAPRPYAPRRRAHVHPRLHQCRPPTRRSPATRRVPERTMRCARPAVRRRQPHHAGSCHARPWLRRRPIAPARPPSARSVCRRPCGPVPGTRPPHRRPPRHTYGSLRPPTQPPTAIGRPRNSPGGDRFIPLARTSAAGPLASSPTADAHRRTGLETLSQTMSTYGCREKPQVNEGTVARDAHRYRPVPSSRRASFRRPRRA